MDEDGGRTQSAWFSKWVRFIDKISQECSKRGIIGTTYHAEDPFADPTAAVFPGLVISTILARSNENGSC
jgi:hypothetical protein